MSTEEKIRPLGFFCCPPQRRRLDADRPELRGFAQYGLAARLDRAVAARCPAERLPNGREHVRRAGDIACSRNPDDRALVPPLTLAASRVRRELRWRFPTRDRKPRRAPRAAMQWPLGPGSPWAPLHPATARPRPAVIRTASWRMLPPVTRAWHRANTKHGCFFILVRHHERPGDDGIITGHWASNSREG